MTPNVIDYLDYRDYLKDFYNAKKSAKKEYSYRVFMIKGDLKSPSHLKMVIDGKRNLTNATIKKYITSLDLVSDKEQKYFEALVNYNQESELDRKGRLFLDLIKIKRKKGLNLLEESQFHFFSSWVNVALYVLIGISKIKFKDSDVVNYFNIPVSKKEVLQCFETLQQLKLITLDESGHCQQAQGALSTSDELRSIAIHKFHKQMSTLGLDALSQVEKDKREYNTATVSIPKEKLPYFMEKIRAFRKEINEIASTLEDKDKVYHLNIQFFPLAEVVKHDLH